MASAKTPGAARAAAATPRVAIPAKSGADPFYRYTRERAVLQGHKNATITEIVNTARIVRALTTCKVDDAELARRVAHLQKWLKRHLGVGGALSRGGAVTLQGDLSTADVEGALEAYIARAYLCKMCGLPELDHARNRCAACAAAATG